MTENIMKDIKAIKAIELKQMKDLNNWNEIIKGLYRFVIGANVCYEIHINLRKQNIPVLTANASLFLVGDWIDEDGVSFLERECLLEQQSVSECIEKAIQDYKENMG